MDLIGIFLGVLACLTCSLSCYFDPTRGYTFAAIVDTFFAFSDYDCLIPMPLTYQGLFNYPIIDKIPLLELFLGPLAYPGSI